jgi:hypothetical protein
MSELHEVHYEISYHEDAYIVLVLTVSIPLAAAQEAQPSQSTIVVGSGNDLRCRLDKGLRITKAGEPITARLVESVYVGTILAIPEGLTMKGHLSSVSTTPLSKRTGRLLSGDFTPPKTANVAFDHLILSDGTSLPIHTDTTVGISGVKTAQYLPKAQRPGVRKKVKDAAQPLREPNKLQRLGEAAITTLPYHPEYLDQGTIFDAALLDPITTPTPVQPVIDIHRPFADNYLRLRLLTPLRSQMIAHGASIEAAVSQPYYNSDHVLLYPAGTKLEGIVSKATHADWMKKNGKRRGTASGRTAMYLTSSGRFGHTLRLFRLRQLLKRTSAGREPCFELDLT